MLMTVVVSVGSFHYTTHPLTFSQVNRASACAMSKECSSTPTTLRLRMVSDGNSWIACVVAYTKHASLLPVFYKNIKLKGTQYNLKIVDTAGQDEYSIFPHAYAMDIHGYCLVYRYALMFLLSTFLNEFFF